MDRREPSNAIGLGAAVLGISVGCILLASCANTLRIQSDFLPDGSLRVAQVVYVATRDQTLETKVLYDALLASGVKDAEIKDGSVVLARVLYCDWMPGEGWIEQGGIYKAWFKPAASS